MKIETAAIGLTLLVLVVVYAECNPQLTFSTDWSGGRRESGSGSEDLDLLQQLEANSELNVDKRRPGWGKRAPGWGKRSSEAEAHELKVKLNNLYKDYEKKAAEIKKMLELVDVDK